MLCKYKNIFGEPNTELHKYRLFNIAIVDVVATFFLGYIIHVLNQKYGHVTLKKLKFVHIILILFILSIILHRLFCVKTTIDQLLFS